MLVVVLQGEGEVEVVDLPDGHDEQLEAHLVSPEDLREVEGRRAAAATWVRQMVWGTFLFGITENFSRAISSSFCVFG